MRRATTANAWRLMGGAAPNTAPPNASAWRLMGGAAPSTAPPNRWRQPSLRIGSGQLPTADMVARLITAVLMDMTVSPD